MSDENLKAHEIKRLTTPLSFKDAKAYDIDGNLIRCVETIKDIRYDLEPKEGILSDDEILEVAPKSKAASRVRLKRGIGNSSDVWNIHQSLPFVLGIYYVALICILYPVMYYGNRYVMLIALILFIVPLIYLYRLFDMKVYPETDHRKTSVNNTKVSHVEEPVAEEPAVERMGVESLKGYEEEVNKLKVLYNVKKDVLKDLIEKRFAPPQITYDKFMSVVDSADKLFNSQAESALNIINLAAEDTPRVRDEIESKISSMKTIIDYEESLTNELVINISNETSSDSDVKNLLDDMENLIGSVKEY